VPQPNLDEDGNIIPQDTRADGRNLDTLRRDDNEDALPSMEADDYDDDDEDAEDGITQDDEALPLMDTRWVAVARNQRKGDRQEQTARRAAVRNVSAGAEPRYDLALLDS
jgi:hypothetical protein